MLEPLLQWIITEYDPFQKDRVWPNSPEAIPAVLALLDMGWVDGISAEEGAHNER